MLDIKFGGSGRTGKSIPLFYMEKKYVICFEPNQLSKIYLSTLKQLYNNILKDFYLNIFYTTLTTSLFNTSWAF